MDSNGVRTVQSWSNFDDDGARPVLYLQLVSPVQSMDIMCNHTTLCAIIRTYRDCITVICN